MRWAESNAWTNEQRFHSQEGMSLDKKIIEIICFYAGIHQFVRA